MRMVLRVYLLGRVENRENYLAYYPEGAFGALNASTEINRFRGLIRTLFLYVILLNTCK